MSEAQSLQTTIENLDISIEKATEEIQRLTSSIIDLRRENAALEHVLKIIQNLEHKDNG